MTHSWVALSSEACEIDVSSISNCRFENARCMTKRRTVYVRLRYRYLPYPPRKIFVLLASVASQIDASGSFAKGKVCRLVRSDAGVLIGISTISCTSTVSLNCTLFTLSYSAAIALNANQFNSLFCPPFQVALERRFAQWLHGRIEVTINCRSETTRKKSPSKTVPNRKPSFRVALFLVRQ